VPHFPLLSHQFSELTDRELADFNDADPLTVCDSAQLIQNEGRALS
jgi:hypothetical protein